MFILHSRLPPIGPLALTGGSRYGLSACSLVCDSGSRAWYSFMISIQFSALKQTSWHEYAIRFLLGGVATAITGLIGRQFGPATAGLFLAFPAVFCASATLIEKHEREREAPKGSGVRRGQLAAAVDAAGASLGESRSAGVRGGRVADGVERLDCNACCAHRMGRRFVRFIGCFGAAREIACDAGARRPCTPTGREGWDWTVKRSGYRCAISGSATDVCF